MPSKPTYLCRAGCEDGDAGTYLHVEQPVFDRGPLLRRPWLLDDCSGEANSGDAN